MLRKTLYFWPLVLLIAFGGVRAQTPHSITLNWSADSTATGGFNIYRGTATGGPYTKIASVAANVLTYKDTSGAGGTKYYYVVTGLDTATPPDESGYSNEASASFLANPAPPAGLAATSQ